MKNKIILTFCILIPIFDCKLDKKIEHAAKQNTNSIEIVAISGLRLRKDFRSEKDILEILPNGNRVELIENSNHFDYKDGRIGNWIKVRTSEGKIGWIFSGFTNQIYSELENLETKEEPQLNIGNRCYTNKPGRLFFKNPNENEKSIADYFHFNHPIIIERISDDKNWYFAVNDFNKRKIGWINKRNLTQNSKIKYIDQTKSNDTYVINRGSTNLRNYTNDDGKIPPLISNGMRFHVQGNLKSNENVYYGYIDLPTENYLEFYKGFLSAETLIEFSEYRQFLIKTYPKLSSILFSEFGSEDLNSAADDGCHWSSHDRLYVNPITLVIEIGSWYDINYYEIVSIKEDKRNKKYSLYILPTKGSSMEFSRFKFNNKMAEINLNIIDDNTISLNGKKFNKNGSSGEQIDVQCKSQDY
ncbi:MAG: SH3 domain-containing protein [Microcystis aeruginosa W13-15]|nr:SH3 domain-containing protein [Microcystis aeruginosa W13-15]